MSDTRSCCCSTHLRLKAENQKPPIEMFNVNLEINQTISLPSHLLAIRCSPETICVCKSRCPCKTVKRQTSIAVTDTVQDEQIIIKVPKTVSCQGRLVKMQSIRHIVSCPSLFANKQHSSGMASALFRWQKAKPCAGIRQRRQNRCGYL